MQGRPLPLSLMRRFVGDLLHATADMPTVPVQRRMRLDALLAARQAMERAPSWPAIFIKAYAKVADAMPELRRAYVKFPWPQLYEYSTSRASIAVERDYQGEKEVFIGHIKDPARLPLREVSRIIQYLKEVPVEDCQHFRQILRLSSVPWPLRRWLWWLGLNIGQIRKKHFGTFGLTVYSSLGAESLHPLSPLTATLNYGVIAPDGGVDVRIIYDHRVLNGPSVARALASLEAELSGATLAELRATNVESSKPVGAKHAA